MPQCVLCNCLGLASLPSRPIGVLSRLKCDSVEAKVSRFNTWDTPDLAPAERSEVQFPVASEYLRPLVLHTIQTHTLVSPPMKIGATAQEIMEAHIVLDLTASMRLNSFPMSTLFWR